MLSKLVARVARLEVQAVKTVPAIFRYGWLKPLPQDFVGERHIVIVKREQTRSPYTEWCHFEERAGPGPDVDADGSFSLLLTERKTI
jgi:hypothetical protein